MKDCDLIISAPWLLPIAPQNVALRDHGLAINEGQIIAVDTAEALHTAFSPQEVLKLPNHILLPGLINTHGHAAMTLLRGAGEDQSLQSWLTDTIWPIERRLMSREFVQLGTELAIAEMLQSGTTTFADMYFFPDIVAQTARTIGMRAQVAFPVIEFANAWSDSVADGLHKGLALIDEYRHHELISIAFGPHAAYTVKSENLQQVAMYANELETQVQIHLHENAAEVAEAQAQHGKTWVQVLHDVGLVSNNLQAVHMTQVNEADRQIIVDSHAKIAHCPTSNMKLASGYCDVTSWLDQGVAVALGTDGAASNNSLDLFGELRLATLMAKHHQQDPSQASAPQMLHMATLGGAQVLGIEDRTGSLEVGKQADVIAVSTLALDMLPLHDPFAALVHGDAGRNVTDVLVNGVPLIRSGAFSKIDAVELAEHVESWHSAHFS